MRVRERGEERLIERSSQIVTEREEVREMDRVKEK